MSLIEKARFVLRRVAAEDFDITGNAMKRIGIAVALFAVTILTGCANCGSCEQIPGWDGRYANYYRGPTGEGGLGLPITPYVPQ